MDELGYLPLNSREEFEALRRFLRQKEPDAPYLREELELCQKRFPPPEAEELTQVLLDRASLWDVKRAAAYYKVIRYSYGAGGGSFGGQATDIRRTIGQIWTCSRRLGDVVIENLSYETIIPRYDGTGTLLYLDPPYYQAECYDVPFCLLDHMRLHSLVCGCRNAFVALSYNDHPVIRELYQGFWQFTTSRPNPLRNRSGGGRYEELIITNYDPEVWSRPPQLSLFQCPEKGPGEKYHPIQKGENNAELRKWRGKQVRRRLQKSLWR
jgi:DNA adenine methylase